MGNYYCLVAGLPELRFDESKLPFEIDQFKVELEENLQASDFELVKLSFMKFDNENLIATLNNPDAEINSLGNLSKQDLLEIIKLFKEEESPVDQRIYPYFRLFIPSWLSQKPIVENLSWGDQLNALYYQQLVNCSNDFIANWYEFNLNITNIFSGLNARKFGFDLNEVIVGDDEVANLIRTSNAKDFSLAPIFPEVDEVIKITEEQNFFERERKIDRLRWTWLESNGVFFNFSIERIFIYLHFLTMLNRWTKLDGETGNKAFRNMIYDLRNSFEFPAEFKLNK